MSHNGINSLREKHRRKYNFNWCSPEPSLSVFCCFSNSSCYRKALTNQWLSHNILLTDRINNFLQYLIPATSQRQQPPTTDI